MNRIFHKTMHLVLILSGNLLLTDVRAQTAEWGDWYDLIVLPAEHRMDYDNKTGAALLYLTSNPVKDINLYYHQRSWLSNSSAILFYSERENGGLMAYCVKTGELICLPGPDGQSLNYATAAVHRNTIFAIWDNKVIEQEIKIQLFRDTGEVSKAQARIRILCDLKPSNQWFDINESCDGRYLVYATIGDGPHGGPKLFLVDSENGGQRQLAALPPDRGPAVHIQWSRTDPTLLSFSSRMEPYPLRAGPRTISKGPEDYLGRCQRLWVLDINSGVHIGVSNWRRNPGLVLVGQGPDPCEKTGAVDPVGIRSLFESAGLASQKGIAIAAGFQQRWMPQYVEQIVHNLDVMNWMMGSAPLSCFGMGGRAVRTGPEFGNIFDHFTVEYEYPGAMRNLAMSAQMAGTTNRVSNRIEGTDGWGTVDRATARIEGKNPWKYDGEPKNPEEVLFSALIKGIREGLPMNDGKLVAEATMTAIMGRTSAYTGRELKWDWIMKASKQDLTPARYEMGPLPVAPVSLPGQTPLI
jgi:hypothetical protein